MQSDFRRSGELFFSFGTTLIFLVLAILGMIYHEMWRDEYHIWVLAQDSASLADLYRNAGSEGHPLLWYILVWLATKVSSSPAAIQILSLTFSVGAVFIILRYAPFKRLHRVLAVSGYFMLFEYTTFARVYSLSFFLIILIAALLSQQRNKLLLVGVLILLLAQTTFYGMILAACFTAYILLSKRKSKSYIAAGISLVGIVISIAEVYRQIMNWGFFDIPKDETPKGIGWIADQFGIFTEAFLPIPDFRTDHFWNSNIIADLHPAAAALSGLAMIAIAMLVVFKASKHNLKYFFVFVLGIGAMTIFSFFFLRGWERHHGHMFLLLFVVLWWIASDNKQSENKRSIPSWFLSVILLVQVPGGVYALAQDFLKPFSHAEALGNFINSSDFEHVIISGSHDYTLIGAAAISNRKFYFPESQKFANYPYWDIRRRDDLRDNTTVIKRAYELFQTTGRDVMLVLSKPQFEAITPENIKPLTGIHPATIEFDLRTLGEYSGAIVEDENYLLYMLTHDNSNPLPMPTQPGTDVPIKANSPLERRELQYEIEGFSIDRRRIRIEGWGYAPELDSATTKRSISFKDGATTYNQEFYPIDREDVRDSLQNPKAFNSGFALETYALGFPPGRYVVGIYYWDAAGRVAYAETPYQYQVVDPALKFPFGGQQALIFFPFETHITSSAKEPLPEYHIHFEKSLEGPDVIVVNGFVWPEGKNYDPFYSVAVHFKGHGKSYFAGVNRVPDPELTASQQLHSSILPKFTARISKQTLDKGQYELSLLIIHADGSVERFQPQVPIRITI